MASLHEDMGITTGDVAKEGRTAEEEEGEEDAVAVEEDKKTKEKRDKTPYSNSFKGT